MSKSDKLSGMTDQVISGLFQPPQHAEHYIVGIVPLLADFQLAAQLLSRESIYLAKPTNLILWNGWIIIILGMHDMILYFWSIQTNTLGFLDRYRSSDIRIKES